MQNNRRAPKSGALTVRELAVFSILGTLMFCSKILMELLPNIHLLGVFVISFTLVYRAKALIPIYIYVFLNGLFAGFSPWWIPYLYIWAILWAMAMLIPKKAPRRLKVLLCPVLCALHGLSFGALYMPAQAIMYGMDLQQSLAWIAAGLPFDLMHCGGNLAAGLLILPLSELLQRLEEKHQFNNR